MQIRIYIHVRDENRISNWLWGRFLLCPKPMLDHKFLHPHPKKLKVCLHHAHPSNAAPACDADLCLLDGITRQVSWIRNFPLIIWNNETLINSKSRKVSFFFFIAGLCLNLDTFKKPYCEIQAYYKNCLHWFAGNLGLWGSPLPFSTANR